jgi:hypothetical protein
MRTLRKTGTLKVAQKLLGHTDIAIAAKFYIDVTVEDLRGAMESISAQNVDRNERGLLDGADRLEQKGSGVDH